MTVRPTSEELMAYADGQLDADHSRRIEQALAENPGLRAEVEDHRRTRSAAREAFEEMATAPMSPDLAALSAKLSAPRAPAAWAAGARSAAERRKLGATLAWPAALAACLVVGFAGGSLTTASNNTLIDWRNGPSAGPQLVRVLEKSPAGEIAGRGDRQALVVASFRAGDGRFCRQFEIGGGVSDGLACRNAGRWDILAIARRPGGPGSFQVAGGGDPVAVAVAGLAPGPRIEGDAERNLIRTGWMD
jgi:hypothetical protein